jgi:hypothetical protein
MMRRWTCLVGTMLCCVLTIATSAHAECVWVLWQEHRKVGTSWQDRALFFERAYTTREECERRREDGDVVAGNDNETKAARRIPDDGIRRFYQCVPDTVDPRGPKGK